jgi:hypothetical protein
MRKPQAHGLKTAVEMTLLRFEGTIVKAKHNDWAQEGRLWVDYRTTDHGVECWLTITAPDDGDKQYTRPLMFQIGTPGQSTSMWIDPLVDPDKFGFEEGQLNFQVLGV